ncbi:MAG TPA: shikimate kinase [Thermoanaerobaculia bacterium]|nr:shikimate kinase [Thermoanaerobaculia bacterium]
MKIYLVGFMGSGKTTIGRERAARIDVSFFDLDELIESAEKMTIREMFAQKGEPYFRKRERDVLRSTRHLDSAVIATGSGTPAKVYASSNGRRELEQEIARKLCDEVRRTPNGVVVQSVSPPACHAGGRGFAALPRSPRSLAAMLCRTSDQPAARDDRDGQASWTLVDSQERFWMYDSLFHRKLLDCLTACFADVPELRKTRAKKLKQDGGCCDPGGRLATDPNCEWLRSPECCPQDAGGPAHRMWALRATAAGRRPHPVGRFRASSAVSAKLRHLSAATCHPCPSRSHRTGERDD